MKIKYVEIDNFRSIRHLSLDLGETTVFIGPNNAGKTAILDAIQVALPNYGGQRKRQFNERDIHLRDGTVDSKNSDGVNILLTSVEEKTSRADLDDIVQLDLSTNQKYVRLRTQYRWNGDIFEENRNFLDLQGERLVGSGRASRTNLNKFRQYLPVFYLGALRNVNDEFSSRSSQFWGRLLKAVRIPQDVESKTLKALNQINEQVLEADPHLERIVETLRKTTEVVVQSQKGGNVSLQILPSNVSEILSKIQIILRNESQSPWLPIRYQGEGMQSLLVVFLFQAFIECLLGEFYGAGCEPILLLEEPETHLHPHAVRTLWKHIQQIPGQKIITTHSPYFIQHVPFRDLRIVRHSPNGTEVISLPDSFSAVIPPNGALKQIVSSSGGKFSYNDTSETLTVTGKLEKQDYHKLLRCYGSHEDRSTVEGSLSDLKNRSLLYVSDQALRDLETHAQRMRGEIFFADGWLIVEGQSDFVIVHAIASALGYDLDKYGISVIDAKNNGSPDSFAMLARAFNIPWQAVFDNDEAGRQYISQIESHGFEEVDNQCHTHRDGDLESQLIADGFETELREVLDELGVPNVQTLGKDGISAKLRGMKRKYSRVFAERLRGGLSISENQLIAFHDAIRNLC